MKILTWNCSGGFRKKFNRILHFEADVCVIQESENFELIDEKIIKTLRNHYSNFLWTGDNKNKGLGILTKSNVKVDILDWNLNHRGRKLKHFLPITINNDLTLLAVWTHQANAKAFAYIGQFWLLLQNNKKEFKNIIIAGDFNSNSIWDSWDRWWNHSDCVKELENLYIYSVYHKLFNEQQGQESLNTFYLQKNVSKGYHIDYVFASEKYFNKNTKLIIEDIKNWIDISDHVPILFEVDDVSYLSQA